MYTVVMVKEQKIGTEELRTGLKDVLRKSAVETIREGASLLRSIMIWSDIGNKYIV